MASRSGHGRDRLPGPVNGPRSKPFTGGLPRSMSFGQVTPRNTGSWFHRIASVTCRCSRRRRSRPDTGSRRSICACTRSGNSPRPTTYDSRRQPAQRITGQGLASVGSYEKRRGHTSRHVLCRRDRRSSPCPRVSAITAETPTRPGTSSSTTRLDPLRWRKLPDSSRRLVQPPADPLGRPRRDPLGSPRRDSSGEGAGGCESSGTAPVYRASRTTPV